MNDDEQAAVQRLPALKRLDRDRMTRSLHEEIYGLLREALMAGDFVPGQVLSTRVLARCFGTSLIPVRDALNRLVSDRAMVTLPNRTFCVPRMMRSRFQELLRIRLCLEPMLAERAAMLASESTIREMARVNVMMQDAVPHNDVRGYLSANQQFHFILYRAADSEATLPFVETLWSQVGPFLNGVFTTLGTQGARDNHTQVLRALRRRDPQETGRAIARDLGDAADVILGREDFLMDEVAGTQSGDTSRPA